MNHSSPSTTDSVATVDNYGKTYEVRLEELKWRPSAYGIVLKDGMVLLSPQFGENKYDLPGGGIELGETPEQAVVREVREETGLDVVNPRLVNGVSRFFTFAQDPTNLEHIQSIMLYYVCDLVGGELSTDGFDEYEKEYARLAVWFPVADLDSIEVASTCDWREMVKQAAA